MFGIGTGKSRMERVVETAVRRVLADVSTETESRLERYRNLEALNGEVLRLREQIETLEIQKGRRDEEIARKEREIEHKVGLERKRQEFEIEQAKRETEVEIREENLEHDQERFKAQMEFERDHLQKEIDSLRTLTEKLLERLPSAEIIATIGKGG